MINYLETMKLILVIQSLASIQLSSSFTPSFIGFPSPSTCRLNVDCSSIQRSRISSITRLSRWSRRSISTKASTNGDNTTNSSFPPIPTEWKGEIFKSLSSIIDPDLNRDIVTLGFIQNLNFDEENRQLSFDVQLTTPACPIKEEFQTLCQDNVNKFNWTNGKAIVRMTSQPIIDQPGSVSSGDTPFGLSQVKSIIAVSSCKGGVGKSTTAVNLAYALSKLGATVGIFDADFYGPSLPTMVTPDNDAVNFVGRQIAPLSRNGVKLMSFGYVNEGSAVMRGPMVTQLLDQFLSLTYWGPLDYLILDMPPGTGDIQLTLSQRLNITAAVIVTTPQELSFVDVERGIEMFDSVNVPCISVVENMAYLEVEDGQNGKRKEVASQLNEKDMKAAFLKAFGDNGLQFDNSNDNTMDKVTSDLFKIVQDSIQHMESKNEAKQLKIFGQGHKKRLSEQWGIEHTYSVPLLDKIAYNGDNGTPFILEYPDSPQASIYNELAANVVREVVKIQYSQQNNRPTVHYDAEKNSLEFQRIHVENGNKQMSSMLPATLRRDCKCASCVEELTGRQILKPGDVSDSVKPVNINPTGNYALSIDWSDGHRSLYPYKQIRSLLETLGEVTDVGADNEKEVATA